MIRVHLGGMGSGKTLMTVREMFLNRKRQTYYTNIHTNLPNTKIINNDMIVSKNVVGTKKRRDGSIENIYEYKLNKEFWQAQEKPLVVVIDEAHHLFDSRSQVMAC
jgi:thymidine kinase